MVGVLVRVLVGVLDGVFVGVEVRVLVDVLVGVRVNVLVIVPVLVGVGVNVLVGVLVYVLVKPGVSVVAVKTSWQAENSDVLPAGSMAVAVTYWPAVIAPGAGVNEKLTLPVPSVVTLVEPT